MPPFFAPMLFRYIFIRKSNGIYWMKEDASRSIRNFYVQYIQKLALLFRHYTGFNPKHSKMWRNLSKRDILQHREIFCAQSGIYKFHFSVL